MIFFCGCGGANSASTGKAAYRQVSSDQARQMMETESNYIILDVRTQKEYAEGHIPKAICIPNEVITKEAPALLPDKEQKIFVYCRSGRRSKESAQKLADMGYKNIIEFGGIKDWHGEVVTE
nr:rhodanese-like domain-containing protein [Anaerovibrio sp. JC8]